jgi:SAM-dependent methyltransferase
MAASISPYGKGDKMSDAFVVNRTSGTFSWSEHRLTPPSGEEQVLRLLGTTEPTSVLELGPGNGRRALALLQRFHSADFLGFEPSQTLLATARHTLATHAERAAVEGRNLALQLPLENGAADLAVCFDLLESLRMDELYMMISEARRALRPGSLCLFRCLSYGTGIKGKIAAQARAWFPKRYRGTRPLELTHYFSPEDWRVLTDERAQEGWLSRQTVTLERLSGPEATK